MFIDEGFLSYKYMSRVILRLFKHLCFSVSGSTSIPISHPHASESVVYYFPLMPDPTKNQHGYKTRPYKRVIA